MNLERISLSGAVSQSLSMEFMADLQKHSPFFRKWTPTPGGRLESSLQTYNDNQQKLLRLDTHAELERLGWVVYHESGNGHDVFFAKDSAWPIRLCDLGVLSISLEGDAVEKEFAGADRVARLLRRMGMRTLKNVNDRPHGVTFTVEGNITTKPAKIAALIKTALDLDLATRKDGAHSYALNPWTKIGRAKIGHHTDALWAVVLGKVRYSIEDHLQGVFTVKGHYIRDAERSDKEVQSEVVARTIDTKSSTAMNEALAKIDRLMASLRDKLKSEKNTHVCEGIRTQMTALKAHRNRIDSILQGKPILPVGSN